MKAFIRLNAKSLAAKSEQEPVRTIIGREKNAMPAWVWTLEAHAALWLVRYPQKPGLTEA